MSRALILLVAVAALSFATTARAASTETLNARVEIENFTFKPATISISAGTAVTFTNADDIPHSIVAGSGAFHSKALDTGDAYVFTFTQPGRVDYFCGLHPHMQGHIVVTP